MDHESVGIFRAVKSQLSQETYLFLTMLVLGLFSLLILTKFLSYFFTSKNRSGPRGLEAFPTATKCFPIKFIGNVPLFYPFTKAISNVEEQLLKFGGIVKFIALNQTFLAFNLAPQLQTLLRSGDFGHVIKEPLLYDPMQPYITNGVLVSKGSFWQGQRKILMKTQTFSSLKTYVNMLNRQSRQFVSELQNLFKDEAPHQINELINTTFLKVISEMITGCEMDSAEEFNQYHHNFQIWQECLMKRVLNPLLFFNATWKLHPLSRQNRQAVNEMKEFARRRIVEHKARRSVEVQHTPNDDDIAYAGPGPSSFRSVLDELIDAGVEEEQIIDEINTMMFGGHETGGKAIHYFCFCMAHNPEIQKQCQMEVDELFKNNENLTFDSVQSGLKYVERCILETLRMFPPVFMFLRKLSKPLDIEYKGDMVRIPSGTGIIIPVFTLHKKPEYYPEPDKFNPDRFLPEEQAKRHAYAYLPFSAGPRNCLGMKFAMIEMKIIAAHILYHFHINTTDKWGEIPLLPLTTLTPERDYTFVLKQRNL